MLETLEKVIIRSKWSNAKQLDLCFKNKCSCFALDHFNLIYVKGDQTTELGMCTLCWNSFWNNG